MKRREFIVALAGVAAAWPEVGWSQQGKTWRIGYLTPGFVYPDFTLFEVFRQELSTLGYTEGKNLIIDKRAAEGRNDRLPALVDELIALHPDAIVAIATPAIAAAQRATSTIPIVMTPATDPIGSGFVKSFSRPGGNITGLANMYGDTTAKIFDVIRAVLPNARKIAVLMSSNPTHPGLYEVSRSAAQAVGLSTVPIVAATPAELERAFQDIKKENSDAVFVLADPIRLTIVALAAAAPIPAIYQISEFVEAGGLASYGPSLSIMFRRSAQYVDRIFKGAAPADMPVEQPTKFELVLNLKTARLLKLSIPEAVVLRADMVIE
ncbi:ABC transporter substrate-binding protein [Bradyrhizobium sp. sGM-13]|uniref:ABC transporter substrate-binding protein n=1 Tax=Bradyrhizobium sp. sGM-13 TaxID=2831781 RepID=UPI001BD19B19|nr:ABC transporter substrate-binding protein [Bradyrhizobium sp. sGM-13]